MKAVMSSLNGQMLRCIQAKRGGRNQTRIAQDDQPLCEAPEEGAISA